MRPPDKLFLTLLGQEQAKLLRIARALTGQEADAWDMVQEAAIAAYDHFGELKGGPESFGPWIRRILVNRCRNRLKSRSRTPTFEPISGIEPDPEPGPEEQVTSSELWDEVMALEDHHRQVLVLRFLIDMTVEEISGLVEVRRGPSNLGFTGPSGPCAKGWRAAGNASLASTKRKGR